MNILSKPNQNKPFFSLFKTFPFVLMLAMLAFAGTGCNKEDVNPDREMQVYMTDAPGDFLELNVEISKVEIYGESEGWITINNTPKSYNVIALSNGNQVSIGSSNQLKAGSYSEIRLTYGTQSSLKLETGGLAVDHSLGIQSSTTIPIELELDASSDASIVLDFHAAESVVEIAGQYFLDPTVTWIEDTETGVRGALSAEAHAAVLLMTDAQTGSVVVSTYTNAQGEFLMRGVAEGTYDMVIQLSEAVNGVEELTVEGVVVANGSITNTGTITIQ